ncbi:DNA repair protein rad16 [Coemansia sp. RSA 1722]|nr:DNA repair protein rad16 [Coemansia sp. RSA 486]KAJ2234374.1 DNA repair protein rad16 [Coemansia sp. RSA 485]KAJ2600022.1 DNA repair protein rad16 [Coemansia sp. RSA 1721]KAJ2600419.1 DNA repair protein rad16 [Coemansia sp. RSA 1722]KAJ2637272.1 DNA repair protein rad16 [Coemansia sp. RSA 1286]
MVSTRSRKKQPQPAEASVSGSSTAVATPRETKPKRVSSTRKGRKTQSAASKSGSERDESTEPPKSTAPVKTKKTPKTNTRAKGKAKTRVATPLPSSSSSSSSASSSASADENDSDSDYEATTVVRDESDAEEQSNQSDIDQEAMVVVTDSEDEDFAPPPRQKRKRAGTTKRRVAQKHEPAGSDPDSSTDKENSVHSSDNEALLSENPGVKRSKPRSMVDMMPVFHDMKLMLSLQPLPATSSKLKESFSRAKNRGGRVPKDKKRVGGKKKLYEILEGECTSDSNAESDSSEETIDVTTLPMDDVDYSTYTKLFQSHPHLRHTWSSLESQSEPQKIEQPADLKIKLLPFQQEGVWWMSQQENTMFHGGILADEMGMGKTLQTIALLLVNRGKPTLVVCPTVALLQWKAEIEAATDALSILVYYGDDRQKILDANGVVDQEKLAQYDVILTTYAVMESGFRRERTGFRLRGELHKEPSVLHAIRWFRVVLDEAHNIKDRSSNSARAAFELKAERVWGLTGTPLHNRVGELYSLIRMTKTDPFSMYFCHICPCKSLHWNFRNGGKYCDQCLHMYTTHFCYWNMHVLKPIQQNDVSTLESRMGFKKLGRLLDSIMLRRTKVERAQDMGLPPRIVVTRRDKFSPDEEDLYVSLFSNYQREFDTYAMHGTVLNNYANIFELITRMRLAANHPDLLRLKVDNNARVGADASDTLVCALCNEEAEDPVISRCKHVFCRVDAQQYVQGAGESTDLRCPSCFALFDIDLTQPEMKRKAAASGSSRSQGAAGGTLMETMMSTPQTMEYRRSIVNRIDMGRWKSSTKIEALVEELSRHRQSNANIKSIVFSQFVNFLDLIQWRLNRAGFSVCRLDGRMSPSQRDAVIRTFMTHPEYTVFLVSLKAGGVALNLTEASNVYLADCWWNPSVEVQAMDRIHRMGQYRPIKVTRIIIENSIESRIVALQVKKQHLVNSTIGRDKKSLDNLSAQDMQFLFSS